MIDALGAGNPNAQYAEGRAARRILEESRESIAADLGAEPVEVIFTSGGTEADNLGVRGLYLAGGILPGMLDFLRQSSFHQRFCDKGAMRRHLQAVPVYGITEPQPGLLGAAHAPV